MNWKIHRALLIAAIWIAEVLAAGICGFIAALALVPASYAARGYYAFGGEWLIVLGVTLLQAFTLEIGFFLFFLPYTMFYNWAYDNLREKFLKRRQQRRALAG